LPFDLPHKTLRDKEAQENFQAIEGAMWISLPEYRAGTAPRPPASGVILFAQDNGAGKTKLMVQYPTGSASQVGIEP
jgi:hypothetical protein